MLNDGEVTESTSLEMKVKALEPLFVPQLDSMPGLEALMGQPEGLTTYSLILESQCGSADDSQPVEMYDGTLGVSQPFVNKHQAPVGQLQWNNNLASKYNNPGNVSGVRWGTGTLISNDLFLSAGHCFDQSGGGWIRPQDNDTGDTISHEEIAKDMKVNFNYQVDSNGVLQAEQSFPVTELVEYRLGGLDFAVVRLGNNPGQSYGIAGVSRIDPSINDMICIIGHPAGQPKRIEAGDVDKFAGDYMGYNDIDTLGGNSGSGILSSPAGLIVGVHTNGGCNPTETGHNWGLRISKIIAQSQTISALLGYTLTVKKIGNGGVSIAPEKDVYNGDVVTLTANPSTGSNFIKWSGDLTGDSNPISITVDEDKEVTAEFSKCVIASLAGSSFLAAQVNFLRMFRNEVVLKSVFDSSFKRLEKWYYRFSPHLVEKAKEAPSIKNMVKYGFVFPFVSSMQLIAAAVLSIRV